MSLVAGIDYSTHAVDVVWLDEDTDRAEWHRWPLEGKDAFERTRIIPRLLMGKWIGSAIGRYLVDDPWDNTLAVGIEEPRGYNSGALYRVQGAILACLPRSVLVQPWLPSVWRKAVGLPGNASKQDVSRFVVEQITGEASTASYAALGEFNVNGDLLRTWPQDACDAYCIALATRNALQKEDAA